MTLASGLQFLLWIALDPESVYIVQNAHEAAGQGTIVKIPKAGGALVTIVSGLDNPSYPVIDGSWIYWVDEDDGTIMKASTSGGKPVQLLWLTKQPVGNLTAWAGSLYWAFNGTAVKSWQDGSIMTMSETGGAVTTLVAGENAPGWIAVDASGIYWTAADSVRKSLLDGSAVTTLASGISSAGAIALTTVSVDWDTSDGIFQIPKGGGATNGIVSWNVTTGGLTLVGDSGDIFWSWTGDPAAQFSNGFLGAIPSSGGAARYYANPATDPFGLAVDDTFIYWLEAAGPNGGGSLLKIAR